MATPGNGPNINRAHQLPPPAGHLAPFVNLEHNQVVFHSRAMSITGSEVQDRNNFSTLNSQHSVSANQDSYIMQEPGCYIMTEGSLEPNYTVFPEQQAQVDEAVATTFRETLDDEALGLRWHISSDAQSNIAHALHIAINQTDVGLRSRTDYDNYAKTNLAAAIKVGSPDRNLFAVIQSPQSRVDSEQRPKGSGVFVIGEDGSASQIPPGIPEHQSSDSDTNILERIKPYDLAFYEAKAGDKLVVASNARAAKQIVDGNHPVMGSNFRELVEPKEDSEMPEEDTDTSLVIIDVRDPDFNRLRGGNRRETGPRRRKIFYGMGVVATATAIFGGLLVAQPWESTQSATSVTTSQSVAASTTAPVPSEAPSAVKTTLPVAAAPSTTIAPTTTSKAETTSAAPTTVTTTSEAPASVPQKPAPAEGASVPAEVDPSTYTQIPLTTWDGDLSSRGFYNGTTFDAVAQVLEQKGVDVNVLRLQNPDTFEQNFSTLINKVLSHNEILPNQANGLSPGYSLNIPNGDIDEFKKNQKA